MSEPMDNRGSLARDLMANERTFLAWVRTGLALVGVGVVLVELVDSEGTAARIGGALMVLAGAVALVYGAVRYEIVARSLNRGEFPRARRGPWAVAAISLLVAVAGILVVLL